MRYAKDIALLALMAYVIYLKRTPGPMGPQGYQGAMGPPGRDAYQGTYIKGPGMTYGNSGSTGMNGPFRINP